MTSPQKRKSSREKVEGQEQDRDPLEDGEVKGYKDDSLAHDSPLREEGPQRGSKDTLEVMAVTTRAAAKRLAEQQAKEDQETASSQANITLFEELPEADALDEDTAVPTLWKR